MFKTIQEIKDANKEVGHHFFSKDTMGFFNSKIESEVIHDRYFITSENYSHDGKRRRFTARRAKDNGVVDTLGVFNAHATYDQAMETIENDYKDKK